MPDSALYSTYVSTLWLKQLSIIGMRSQNRKNWEIFHDLINDCECMKTSRDGIFKLLRRPGINSKERFCQPMSSGGPIRHTCSYSVPSPLRLLKNSSTGNAVNVLVPFRQEKKHFKLFPLSRYLYLYMTKFPPTMY
jgi:hypothetical protein